MGKNPLGGAYGLVLKASVDNNVLPQRPHGLHFPCAVQCLSGDCLPHMYGPANYIIIDAAHKLPVKVSEIYRRLTT